MRYILFIALLLSPLFQQPLFAGERNKVKGYTEIIFTGPAAWDLYDKMPGTYWSEAYEDKSCTPPKEGTEVILKILLLGGGEGQIGCRAVTGDNPRARYPNNRVEALCRVWKSTIPGKSVPRFPCTGEVLQ